MSVVGVLSGLFWLATEVTGSGPVPPTGADLTACLGKDAAACQRVDQAYGALAGPGRVSFLGSVWAVRACELGETMACGDAAWAEYGRATELKNTILDHGEVPRLLSHAVALARRGCDAGQWDGCVALASIVEPVVCPPGDDTGSDDIVTDESGSLVPAGVEKDAATAALEAADKTARQACDKGDSDACLALMGQRLQRCGALHDLDGAKQAIAGWLDTTDAACQAGDVLKCQDFDAKCGEFDRAGKAFSAAPEDVSPVPVAHVVVSSTHAPWKTYTFGGDQLIDGHLDTSWQPIDKRFGGLGQWFELQLDREAALSKITIANGLQRKDALGDLFVLNNRIRTATITFSDGSTVNAAFRADERGLVPLVFPARKTRSVRVVIEGIHRGSKWNDLAVSEVALFGPKSEVAASAVALPPRCAAVWTALPGRCAKGDTVACDRLRDRTRAAIPGPSTPVALAEAAAACLKSDAAQCGVAVNALLSARPDGLDDKGRKRLSALITHGCRAGDPESCGLAGCHGTDDTVSTWEWLPDAGEPTKALCKAGCSKGDGYSCMRLAGLTRDVTSIPFDAPALQPYVSAASVSECADAAACLAGAEKLQASWDYGPPLGEFMERISLLRAACERGSGPGCALAANAVGETEHSPGADALALALWGAGCSLKDADSCLGLANALGEGSGDKARADAARRESVALWTAACDAGDVAACRSGASELRRQKHAAEAEALDAKGDATLEARCKARDGSACEALASELESTNPERASELRTSAFEAFGQQCLREDGISCQSMCEQLDALLPKAAVFGDNNEATMTEEMLQSLATKIPGLNAPLLLAICENVALADRCNCGCC